MINLEELSTLLAWAVENLGQLNELSATDKGVYFRLMDGRAGLLMMGPRKRGYETDLVARAIVQSRGMC